jgi:homeobox-leucine zipper protein
MFDSHHMLDMTPKSSENDLSKLKDDDYETKSGTETMEAPSGDDQDTSGQRPKKKRYHRHTQRQIQEMEA